MPTKDYFHTKESDNLITTSKTTDAVPLAEPSVRNFFRIKAPKGELTRERSNVAVL